MERQHLVPEAFLDARENNLVVHLADLHRGDDLKNTTRYIGLYFATEDATSTKSDKKVYYAAKPCIDLLTHLPENFWAEQLAFLSQE